MKDPASCRVGIVGAGAAGLSAAYFLRQAGYERLTVLEQESRLGGKCWTVGFQGKALEMGAVELSPEFDDILPMARDVGAPIRTEHGRRMIHVETGKVERLNPFAGVPTRRVLAAVLRYYRKLRQHRAFINGPGLRHMPDDLAMPLGAWLRKHRMEVMAHYFESFLTVYGYGPIDELPAAYAMKYVDLINFNVGVRSKLLGALASAVDGLAAWRLLSSERAASLQRRVDSTSWPRILTHGFQDFWERVADKYFAGSVRLNAKVTHIEPGTPVRVTLADGETLEFDRLIVTSPLDGRLASIMPGMKAPFRALFGEVRTTDYWTTACFVRGLGPGEYVLLPLPEISEALPWGIFKAWEEPVAVFYTTLDTARPEDATDEDGKRVVDGIRRMLAKIGAEVIEIDGREVLAQRRWDYFPHVPAPRGPSFFRELHEAQGQGNVWYSGSLLGFEISQRVVWHSKWLIREYFAV